MSEWYMTLLQNGRNHSPDTVLYPTRPETSIYWFLHQDNTPADQVLSLKKFMGENKEKVLLDWNTPLFITFGSQ
jgi:hypothetical protein